MNHVQRLIVPLLFAALACVGTAQHCAPIWQSFLSGISVRWVKGELRIRIEYSKSGGATLPAYQAYVVAFLEKDAAHVPAPKGKTLLDPKKTVILSTQLIKRDAAKSGDGIAVFVMEYAIKDKDLVSRVRQHLSLSDKDRDKNDYWFFYKERVRLAVFIPLIDDKKYSVLKGLPKDPHECNYTQERYRLFQVLPYRVSLQVGRGDTKGRVWVRIHGDEALRRERKGKNQAKEEAALTLSQTPRSWRWTGATPSSGRCCRP